MYLISIRNNTYEVYQTVIKKHFIKYIYYNKCKIN